MAEIREWLINYNSPYNDGWTKQGYREKLEEVQSFLNKNFKTEKNLR